MLHGDLTKASEKQCSTMIYMSFIDNIKAKRFCKQSISYKCSSISFRFIIPYGQEYNNSKREIKLFF